jgi:hypothetical protein
MRPQLALHSLVERAMVARLGDWEVWRHPEHSAHHDYFASRSLLHLQLWHRASSTSILTPSGLTDRRFEILRDGCRIAVRAWNDVARMLSELALPGPAELRALLAWTVLRDERARSVESSRHIR